MPESDSALNSLVGHRVVLDLASPFVIMGLLRGFDIHHYIVDEADVHDLRDTTTSRELYVLDAKRHGVNPNRNRVLVRREEVVSLSLVDDIVEQALRREVPLLNRTRFSSALRGAKEHC